MAALTVAVAGGYDTPLKKNTLKRKRTSEVTNLSPNLRKRNRTSQRALKDRTHGLVRELSSLAVELNEKAFLDHQLQSVYKLIKRATGALGGNAGGGAIYGELTMGSFQKIVDFLKESCEFTRESRFIDIGSGLGKPSFHAAIDPGCTLSYGVELEELRWHLSLHNLQHVLHSFPKMKPTIFFGHGNIVQASSFNPFTHIYSFDVGFPPDAMSTMADAFNKSKTAKYLISFHPPKKVIEQYRYRVQLLEGGKIGTSMAGSSEGHTCYVYKKLLPLVLRPTAEYDPDAIVDLADPLFKEGLELLLGVNGLGVANWVAVKTANLREQGRTRGERAKRRLKMEDAPGSGQQKMEIFFSQSARLHPTSK